MNFLENFMSHRCTIESGQKTCNTFQNFVFYNAFDIMGKVVVNWNLLLSEESAFLGQPNPDLYSTQKSLDAISCFSKMPYSN